MKASRQGQMLIRSRRRRSSAAAAIAIFLAASIQAQSPIALTLAIRAERAEVLAGDEIPIVFTITNAGATPHEYRHRTYDRSGRMPEFQLEARDAQGQLVPDPRSLNPRGYIGGGLSSARHLIPGASFSQTIALNLWALVKQPGVYTVRGRYLPHPGAPVVSPPILVRVLPRTPEDTGIYIQQLTRELFAAQVPPPHLIQKLMYTGDPRAAAALRQIVTSDNNAKFWIEQAFAYYLPK